MESELAGQKRSGNPKTAVTAPTPAPAKRAYTMRQRRASMDETRARIVDAALELYEVGGPATTTMSAVAQRAGVTRATLYRHFPTEADVANVVIDEWKGGGPRIDATALAAIADPAVRLRAALNALYAGYRATEAITANLLRDAHALPEARRGELRAPAARVREALAGSGIPWRGAAAAEAATDHALAFETWRSLAAAALDDDMIAGLMVGLVALATQPDSTRPGRRPAAAASAGRTAAPPTPPRTTEPRAATEQPFRTTTRTESRRPAAAAASPAAASSAPPTAALPAEAPRKSKGAGKGSAKTAAKGKAGKKGKGDRKAKGKSAGG